MLLDFYHFSKNSCHWIKSLQGHWKSKHQGWVKHLNHSLVARLSLFITSLPPLSSQASLSCKVRAAPHRPSQITQASESACQAHSWFYLYQRVSRGSRVRGRHMTESKIQGIGHGMALTAFLALLLVCRLRRARIFNLFDRARALLEPRGKRPDISDRVRLAPAVLCWAICETNSSHLVSKISCSFLLSYDFQKSFKELQL